LDQNHGKIDDTQKPEINFQNLISSAIQGFEIMHMVGKIHTLAQGVPHWSYKVIT
jgi:hypothetical protein